MTFSLDIKTAEDIAAEEQAVRAALVKAACKRRIYAVASPEAQTNIVGAAAANVLTADQQAAYAQSVQWIADMRAACQSIIADPARDHTDDAEWPAVPAEVAALAAAF